MNKIEYPNLDFLRAVAVTLVTASHLFYFLGVLNYFWLWGAFGVAIFFVHTSLVLTQSLAHQGRPLYLPFMIRRCFRIYPLAVVILSIVILFRIPQCFSFMNGPLRPVFFVSYNYKPVDILANFFLMQGLQNSPFNTSIVQPMWSLSVEMLMYLVLPLLFLLVNRERHRAVALAGMYLLVVTVSVVGVQHLPGIQFFYHAPVFAGGVISYYLLRAHRFVLPAFCWPLLVITACFVLVHPAASEPSVLYSAIGIAAAIPWFAQITSRPVVFVSKMIARYSYGIYVTHFLCMWVALHKMLGPVPVRLAVFFALLAAVSVALYHGVEEPLIRLGKRVAAKYVDDRGRAATLQTESLPT
jgi:peptidoglycan/LPS O-acetylase OafA/YrhL